MKMVNIIERGTTTEAFWISSDICINVSPHVITDERWRIREWLHQHLLSVLMTGLDLLTWPIYWPVKVYTDPISPIMKDRPCVGQSPVFKNVLKTSSALWCDPKSARGSKIAKNPNRWIINIEASNLGKYFPTMVFMNTLKTVEAQNSSTVCHGWGVYEDLVRVISPWTWAPARKYTDARGACQPQTVSHPDIGQERLRREYSCCLPVA